MTTQSISLEQTAEDVEPFQTGQVLTIVGGHFTHDVYSAFVAPLLPLIIQKLSLSLTLAGGLVAVMQFPAILNPFIGYLADRVSLRYFVILAPAITGILCSLLGVAPNYATLVVMLLVAGISTACFHAPAPAMIARLSGNNVGRGMSFFMAGGELGRTIGPLVAVWAVSAWTLDGFYRIMFPSLLASLLLYWRLRSIPARPEQRQDIRLLIPAARKLFLPLVGIVFPRMFILVALQIYLPTFMSRQGASLQLAALALSLLELAGVAGALMSGTLSDRFGRKTVLLVSIVSSSVLMLVFLNVTGWLLVPVLLALGFTILSPTPVMLAVVQDHMTTNRAVGNGVFLAISFLANPIAIFATGFWGDKFGLPSAYFWSAFVALLALPSIFLLPEKKHLNFEP